MKNDKEYEYLTLEDGNEYMIIDEIEIDDINYVYLSNGENNENFRVRKNKKVGNIEMLVGLDSDQEFDKAMPYFVKKHKDDLE